MAMRWVRKFNMSSGVSIDGLEMVVLLCFCRWSYKVASIIVLGMCHRLIGAVWWSWKWLRLWGRDVTSGLWVVFIGQLVAGLWLEEAGCCRVGMQLCLDCLTGSSWGELAVCGSVLGKWSCNGAIFITSRSSKEGILLFWESWDGVTLMHVWSCEGCCVYIYWADVVSVAAICTALCFYHVAARCSGWSYNGTFTVWFDIFWA